MRTLREFTAGTWNMGGGEGPDGPTFEQVQRVCNQMKNAGMSIGLFLEAQKDENVKHLHSLGYFTHQFGPESVVAWLDPWVAARTWGMVLNEENPFFRKGGSKPIFCRMARVVLCNPFGQSVDAGAYHTPSSVQEKVQPKNRILALREAADNWQEIGEDSLCDAVLLGGDDNVDEEGGAFGPWTFMTMAGTGLRQITAPRNTLGKRKVDDFRVKGLKPIDEGLVIQGPTHHNAHLQTFRFTKG
jgi:hypothetical protein